jgi:ATP-dependent RNA helicase SUPV3L1/SUV3
MCNYDKVYDVAVIDEAQLIADSVRGGNWLKALLLINAREVHVCTAPEALQIIISLLEQTNAEYKVIQHERLTPLVFAGEMTSIKKVEPGDALIAFSRKGVLSIAASLEELGIKASVIYGALPPASRREEVRRFTSGETSVVVATDAIGMGVSLPIKRIIFCDTAKFNGTKMCDLTTSEIKQIAGRAGRYGKYDVGEVLTFKKPYLIKDALSANTPEIQKLIMPFPEQAIGSQFSIPMLLKAWGSLPKEKTFKRVDMSECCSLYNALPKSMTSIDKKTIYSFICCPVDQKSLSLVDYWRSCCVSIVNNEDLPEPIFDDSTLAGCELKYRAFDIKHQMARRINCEDDSIKEKEKLCKKINAFLSASKSDFLSRCSICGKKLPVGYAYGMCQKCYATRYWF